MANIHREIPLSASADEVWKSLQNPAEINQLLTFLGDVTYDEDTGNRQCAIDGGMLDELVVDVDHDRRRIAYAIVGSPFGFAQHSAAMHVVERDGGSTFLWDHDFTPDDVKPAVEGVVDGAAALVAERFG